MKAISKFIIPLNNWLWGKGRCNIPLRRKNIWWLRSRFTKSMGDGFLLKQRLKLEPKRGTHEKNDSRGHSSSYESDHCHAWKWFFYNLYKPPFFYWRLPQFYSGYSWRSLLSGIMLGALYVERLISRIGHIRSFAMMASINSVIIVAQSFYIDPYSWTFYRILTGFCTSGFFIAIESWLLLSSGIKSRGKLLSLYMLTLYLMFYLPVKF